MEGVRGGLLSVLMVMIRERWRMPMMIDAANACIFADLATVIQVGAWI